LIEDSIDNAGKCRFDPNLSERAVTITPKPILFTTQFTKIFASVGRSDGAGWSLFCRSIGQAKYSPSCGGGTSVCSGSPLSLCSFAKSAEYAFKAISGPAEHFRPCPERASVFRVQLHEVSRAMSGRRDDSSTRPVKAGNQLEDADDGE